MTDLLIGEGCISSYLLLDKMNEWSVNGYYNLTD